MESTERASDDAAASQTDLGARLLRHMRRARIVSTRMITLQREGRIGYHTASIGQEAAVVGAVLAARDTDWIFPGAREWYAAIARGLPIQAYVHHVFGSARDAAKGHATPDHGPARAFRVVPPSGVVGAHLPQAVGAAWASRIQKDGVRVVALFGSEVMTSGDAHNALNFAGVFKAPVVFVCRSRAGENVTDRAIAYGLASVKVEGGDPEVVHATVRAALARADEGKGATLVEVVTPRPLGEDDLAPPDHVDAADAPFVRELDAAIAEAEAAGAPAPESIFDDVYASVPPHLVAQRRMLTGGKRRA